MSIKGFQLTNPNYTHSVALLHEHFGQPYKQSEAHMQALINIPTPNQSYSSLQEFQHAEYSIERCYFPAHVTQPTIHCFADASQKAYRGIVFLVNHQEVSFVLAKTRVAPLKQLTLPCRELLAALVATRLAQFVATHLQCSQRQLEVLPQILQTFCLGAQPPAR